MDINQRYRRLLRETGHQEDLSPTPLDYCKDVTWGHRLITFPRCGHHMLSAALLLYYNLGGENYCEYHQCCNSYPCGSKKHVLIHKNHDFDLKAETQVAGTARTIVGIRHPYDALLSWYAISDQQMTFYDFVKAKSEYFNGFIRKWAIKPTLNCYLYEYSDLVQHFTGRFCAIISHLTPEHRIDTARVQAIAANIDRNRPLTKRPYEHHTDEARRACNQATLRSISELIEERNVALTSSYT